MPSDPKSLNVECDRGDRSLDKGAVNQSRTGRRSLSDLCIRPSSGPIWQYGGTLSPNKFAGEGGLSHSNLTMGSHDGRCVKLVLGGIFGPNKQLWGDLWSQQTTMGGTQCSDLSGQVFPRILSQPQDLGGTIWSQLAKGGDSRSNPKRSTCLWGIQNTIAICSARGDPTGCNGTDIYGVNIHWQFFATGTSPRRDSVRGSIFFSSPYHRKWTELCILRE